MCWLKNGWFSAKTTNDILNVYALVAYGTAELRKNIILNKSGSMNFI